MRRVAGHLVTFASALSLLLCAAGLVVWVLSYSRSLGITRREAMGRYVCGISHGVFCGTNSWGRPEGAYAPRYGWSATSTTPPYDLSRNFKAPDAVAWGGFCFRNYEAKVAEAVVQRSTAIYLPSWFVCGVLGLLPAWWFIFWRKKRLRQTRLANGHCLSCGYDLRVSPQRCPECGTANPHAA